MSSKDFKAPPALSKCVSYETWLKEIKIWQKFTNLAKGKQGPAIFLTLEGRAREAVLELDVDIISDDTGVENILKHLNKLYLKDKTQSAYEAYEKFEKFKRPSDMSMTDFINEFERLKSKTKQYGTEMSTDILAYRLLKSANLSESHEQLAKATISDLTYECMKTQLKKIFGDVTAEGIDASFSSNIKVEPVYEVSDEQEAYYGNASRYSGRGRGQHSAFKSYSQVKAYSPGQRGRGQNKYFRGAATSSTANRKGRNPLNHQGAVSRCSICDSINHWMVNCPDAVYYQETFHEDSSDNPDNSHHVTLFQSNLITDDHMKAFVCESFSAAILDSGATATVAGRIWVECYIDSLSEHSTKSITYHKSNNSFKFGSGKLHQSLYMIMIPAYIGSKNVWIEVDVIETDIPLLMSKKAMKKANTTINFKNDTVTMFGEKLNVLVTQSGHYAVPLDKNHKVLSDAESGSARIILHVKSFDNKDKNKMASKLHSQFSHPSVNKLIKLVSSAGMGDDTQLLDEIRKVSNSCKICQEYRRPSPRPVIGMPLATEFNEVVAMDLKKFQGRWILHLIDHLSRFSAACFLQSKNPEEVIDKIFQIWISIFGPPKRFLSDNGGEFSNQQFHSLCESFNITVMTTAAEAPWSNGLCERHNAVLADMLEKTVADNKCTLKTALSWSIHAKNSLANVHGFTPYQIAIGYTPRLPSNLFNDPPALETDLPHSKIVSQNLNSIAAARRAFIEAENSERVKRALRHNIRPSSNKKFYVGDSVYYKRNDSKKWKGPGKVIGQDSQQVLIKHGGVYVRVHPCRTMHENESHHKSSNEKSRTGDSECVAINQNDAHDSNNEDDYSEENEELVESDTAELVEQNINAENRVQTDITASNLTVANTSNPCTSSVKLRKGMRIEYLPDNSNDWIKGKVHSRAGKSTGKYKSHWNILEDDVIKEVNLDSLIWRDIGSDCSSFEKDRLCENTESHSESTDSQEISLCEIYLSHVDQQTLDAKKIELENWKLEKVYKEVHDEGQETISVRWVVTPKLIDGLWSTKARLVARGFEEDKSELRTDSPTCMRETVKVVLTMAVSNQWNINSIDIKAAFLQGKPISRDVFLKPPKEAHCVGKLWLLNKVVYGLSDASRVWYMRVVDELTKLGVSISKYDKALFMWKENNVIQGIIVVHVDDFLWCGSDNFKENVIMPMKNIFKISKEYESAFKYIGIDLKQNKNYLIINQRSYTDSIKEIVLPNSNNLIRDQEVTDTNLRKQFKGLVGQLSWASGISRPDAAFNACVLSTVQSSPTFKDFFEANKAVRDLKSAAVEIKYPILDLNSISIAVYSDASYGNLKGGGSQGGHIVFLRDNRGTCAPVVWSSKKIKRVVRSTLGAETLSAVDAMDSAYLISNILKEILVQKEEREIEVFLYTDNKSLYDSMNTSNLMIDKRLRVDISSLREMHDKGEVNFRWIEGDNQLADVLTKRGATKKKLLNVLTEAHLRV